MHDLPTMHASRATTASSSIINKRMNNNGRNGRMNEGKEQEEKDVGFNESIISKLYFKNDDSEDDEVIFNNSLSQNVYKFPVKYNLSSLIVDCYVDVSFNKVMGYKVKKEDERKKKEEEDKRVEEEQEEDEDEDDVVFHIGPTFQDTQDDAAEEPDDIVVHTIGCIGQGLTSTVYSANILNNTGKKLKGTVAVKEFNRNTSYAVVSSEVRLLRRLDHSNIITFLGYLVTPISPAITPLASASKKKNPKNKRSKGKAVPVPVPLSLPSSSSSSSSVVPSSPRLTLNDSSKSPSKSPSKASKSPTKPISKSPPKSQPNATPSPSLSSSSSSSLSSLSSPILQLTSQVDLPKFSPNTKPKPESSAFEEKPKQKPPLASLPVIHQLVMEHCSRGNLFDLLHQPRGEAKVSLAEIARKYRTKIIIGVAKGMAYLHKYGIVHRDLSSKNVLMTQGWEPKIADFGQAKQVPSRVDPKTGKKIFDGTLIGPGGFGTDPWRAPEVWRRPRGQMVEYSLPIDVYSYAIVLWELYHLGHVPWDTTLDVEDAIKRGKRPKLVSDSCPATMSALIQGCWLQDPSLRHNFAEVLEDLQDIFG